jgi:hypothetical protein
MTQRNRRGWATGALAVALIAASTLPSSTRAERAVPSAATNDPVMMSESYQYKTEWVWLLSIYERQLNELARALSDKYRKFLKIPEGMYITPEQWLDASITVRFYDIRYEIGGLSASKDVTIEDTACLGSARAEFGSRKKRMDAAFARAFENWSEVVARHDDRAIAALWVAEADLALLAQRIDETWTARWRRYLTKLAQKGLSKLVGDASKVAVEDTVDRLTKGWPKVKVGATTAWIGKKMIEQAKDKGPDVLKDAVNESLKAALFQPDKGQLTELAEQLAISGDKMLFDRAYMREEEAIISAPDAEVAFKPAFYLLNGPLGRATGYNTGFGVLFAQPMVLSKWVEGKVWRYTPQGGGPRAVRLNRLDYFAFEKTTRLVDTFNVIVNGEVREVTAFSDGPMISDGPDELADKLKRLPQIGRILRLEENNFPDLLKEYEDYKRQLLAEAREKANKWFEVISAGSTADEKLHAMAASQLLRVDLQKFMAEDIPRQIKEKALSQLGDKISDLATGGLGRVGKISVVGALIKDAVEAALKAAVDWFAPDPAENLTKLLQTTKLRIADSIRIEAPRAVLPKRDDDLAKLVTLNAEFTLACSDYDRRAAATLFSTFRRTLVTPDSIDLSRLNKDLRVYQRNRLYALGYRESATEKVYFTGFYRVAILTGAAANRPPLKTPTVNVREVRTAAEQYFVVDIGRQIGAVSLTVQQFRPLTEGREAATRPVMARFEEFLKYAKDVELIWEDVP